MNDIEQCGKILKKDIITLINNNDLQNAKKIINDYEELIPHDIDVYSIKGVIAMMEGNMNESEKILKEGISIIEDNFDLNYNLAYLYEIEEKYIESYKYYKKSLEYCNSDIKEQILDKIMNFEKTTKIIEYKDQKVKNASRPPIIKIFTKVYNVKEYIHECAESVLGQTFKDFEWVVLDNGCTDGTSEILEKYAERDSRIKLFKNEVNNIIYGIPENKDFIDYFENLESEYLCCLDSDDFLHKDFLKDLYIAAKKYNADVAVAGTQMFNDENQNLRGNRCPPTFHTNDVTELGNVFPNFYGSFRSLWGKLIKTSIDKKVGKFIQSSNIKIFNGGDTYMCLILLKYSNSVVSLNKVLHYYRIRNNSLYQSQVNKNRYLDYIIIYEESKKLLESWNKLNDTNLNFITEVLYSSMKDCIDISAKTLKAPLKDRIEVITSILSDIKLRKILNDKGVLINLIDEGINALNIIAEKNTKTI
ncbi:glycosyltransferase family 2 protein [Clostridium sporogenes]|nr:glycosyltransferase family 2 protein [Clostridium sporogenes]NFS24574.1 glycosyltransferase family 2 protein [Clostridium sporogenes]